MTTTKVGYLVALSLLLLAACSPAASTPIASASPVATEALPTVTFTPEPTATSAQSAHPEIAWEQLALMDKSLGSFTQDENGNLIYASPLESVGKNVVFVAEEHQVGLSGGPEIHFSPASHPGAPAVIYEIDAEQFRKGPFGYIEVKRDYTFVKRPEFSQGVDSLLPLIGQDIPSDFLQLIEKGNATMFALSVFPQEIDFGNRDGYFAIHVATPLDSSGDNYSLFYDVVLAPYEEDPMFQAYMGFYENDDEYSIGITEERAILRMRTNDKERMDVEEIFRSWFGVGSQSVIYGMREARSESDIPQNEFSRGEFTGYTPHYRLSFAMRDQMDTLFDILEKGALPDDLIRIDGNLKLFGTSEWYFDK